LEDIIIAGKTLKQWVREHPLLEDIITKKDVFWINPRYNAFDIAQARTPLSKTHINSAANRLDRFASYISRVFPETRKTRGIIESPLVAVPDLRHRLERESGKKIAGKLLLKCDNELAISGSIKARGGIYEVLRHAEDLAASRQLITRDDNYAIFDSPRFRKFFSDFSIAVGSTGNLGLSIGIMGAQLGFQVVVHMSSEAKQWKKDILRQKAVKVIEHEADYSRAVAEGRNQADLDPNMHFVDDENSTQLFLGYAVAASRLSGQLEKLNIVVDEKHPLFVYLPCGVGGSPGGITFGLKQIFKDHVHCFFAEPTPSPCMLLGLMTRLHHRVNVQDFGLNNETDADGLAVGTSSELVGKILEQMISGVYTIQDDTLYKTLWLTFDVEKISLEPSALAGMPGPFRLFHDNGGKRYLESHNLYRHMSNATHIVWATGGNMVPVDIMTRYLKKGKNLLDKSVS